MFQESAQTSERRIFERYVPLQQAFVLCGKRLAIIKNISPGGMAIYSVNCQSMDVSEIEIFLTGSRWVLAPANIVSVSKRLTPGGAITANHIGFRDLTAAQLDTLWHQIKLNCSRVGDPWLEGYRPTTVAHLRQVESPQNREVSPDCLVLASPN